MTSDTVNILLLGLAGGAVNALAGGGPIIVVAALAALGFPADIASLTSTVALLPGQLATGWRGRHSFVALGGPRRRLAVAATALCGGGGGAVLLLATPARVFALLLPFLIAFATALYAWNSRERSAASAAPDRLRFAAVAWLAPLSIYGGFYGGGNSFMVLALFAWARVPQRTAIHAKNLLILMINGAATLIFVTSGKVDYVIAVPLAAGALVGAMAGLTLIDRLDGRWLRYLVIVLGSGLAIWLAARR